MIWIKTPVLVMHCQYDPWPDDTTPGKICPLAPERGIVGPLRGISGERSARISSDPSSAKADQARLQLAQSIEYLGADRPRPWGVAQRRGPMRLWQQRPTSSVPCEGLKNGLPL